MTDIPTYTITDTTHTFTWNDGTCVELRDPARDRTRRLWAETLAYGGPDALLNHKQLDLMDQAACDRFAAGCAALDGVVAWGPRLLYVGHHVADTLALQVPVSLPLQKPSVPWPQLDAAAYYGLAGQIVHTIEPYTESDPVALLVQLLTMVGNDIGREPYFPVEADQHHMNIFLCLVGESSKGRKGTSAGHPKRLLTTMDPAWSARVMGGLSSGEGVIWHVRDSVPGANKKGEEVCLDEGVEDKRLCILETEFARALAKTGQEGNVLSAVLRQAWDHGDLRTLVSGRQKSPVCATHAHISVVAHITVEELQRLLTETEAANGFGNRFLWVCVRRSKLLPRGGLYPEQALKPLADLLATTISHARTIAQMRRTTAAEARWEAIYTTLAEGQPGLLGAITARAEAQVLRLSCLYALLDQTAMVDVPHLDAAYALWRYCEASARYIFRDMLGHPLADELRQMLQLAGSSGMTRTEISDALGRHQKRAAIAQALAKLHQDGFAQVTVHRTNGRPVETWMICPPVGCTREKSEISPLSPGGVVLSSPLNSLNSHAQCAHMQTEQQAEGQVVCLICGELLKESPPPAFTSFTASGLWCSTCQENVSFRMLTQLDGTELYLCETCDTEVGRKHTLPPPPLVSSNGTPDAGDDVPPSGQTSPDGEDAYDEVTI